MQSNIVLALAEYDGHIWIGTDGKGIAVLNPENNQMDVLTHIPGDAYSLPSNSILSFMQIRKMGFGLAAYAVECSILRK